LDRLYTPWRLDYVKGERTSDGCVFCSCQEDADETAYILHRAEHWFVILNRFPYNSGHLLLVLKRHAGSLVECTPAEVAELPGLLSACETAMRAVYRPGGINCGYNGGASAGAGIPGHFHVHMLPRWSADTNFMTVIGDTRIIPETLDDSFAGLRPALMDALAQSDAP
jgi:ATP adenylyltransferase